jgi:hypothetical protein
MASEVWFRNPHNYIREVVEAGAANIAWDRGALKKRGIDPIAHARIYFGPRPDLNYRLLCVGDQGAVEYRKGDTLETPSGVYPVWTYDMDFSTLEDLVENPVGDDPSYTGMTGAVDEIPKAGQEHRVIVSGLPPGHMGPGRRILRLLTELQEDYPECIIHYHGPYTFRVAFGGGLRSADVEVRTYAATGKLMIPSGKVVEYRHVYENVQWAKVMGMKPSDMEIPRNRCIYNIKAAMWAGENYQALDNQFTTRKTKEPDVTSSDIDHVPSRTRNPLSVPLKFQIGDKVTCNTCSVQDKCKHFRDGAVCSLPNAEPRRLAEQFGTRDSEQILDSLTTLMAVNANRLERGLRDEAEEGGIDPKVTALVTALHNQGVSVAKMVDPNLRGGAKVQVNVNSGGQAAVIAGSSPQQLMAGIVRELEEKGFKRSEITPEMIQGLLESKAGAPKAISGEVVNRD